MCYFSYSCSRFILKAPVLWTLSSTRGRTAWVGPGRAGASPARLLYPLRTARRQEGRHTLTKALRAGCKVLPEKRALVATGLG